MMMQLNKKKKNDDDVNLSGCSQHKYLFVIYICMCGILREREQHTCRSEAQKYKTTRHSSFQMNMYWATAMILQCFNFQVVGPVTFLFLYPVL